ncbi:MAG: NAD+ synthase [Solirubrobacteraceae bacterium]|nr:NAD+ synthase [Solirubrobacteraceae bacterium]MDP4672574.1 NAD+ synthase [Solirubrobacteraceae bacterium]MDP4920422.1 NAD+ synthase [Solirubrobacteraceae bacterium]MDP5033916.1 NAD+ synthase [Solirubrobacteraceae bacterium]
MRIALAQINPVVGDITGNELLIKNSIADAVAAGAALVCLPELALTGYPPEDLLLKDHVLSDAAQALERIAASVEGIVAIVGYPQRDGAVYNSAAVLADGRVAGNYKKNHLPNYGVFDEHRYFEAGSKGALIEVDGRLIGLSICEDIWSEGPPESDEAAAGASLIVNLSASPFQSGKGMAREQMLAERATANNVVVAFCAQVGGQDELVFDGHSLVVDSSGATIARAPQFEQWLLTCEVTLPESEFDAAVDSVELLGRFTTNPPSGNTSLDHLVARIEGDDEAVYAALVLGTRDYADKNGFERAVLGLSGGVDSALVACIACDALGAERVRCVTMPSQFSSEGTYSDAVQLAELLGVELLELPIGNLMDGYDALLAPTFDGRAADLTEENLQARIRGNLLMALSNKFGWLVLTTGNKSEMAVGYSTLYGDSAGGFAVIKDVPKTLVYRLCELRNRLNDAPIPTSILTRAPSAELRPDQADEDSLPPYSILDPLLEGYVERDLGAEQLIAEGFDPEIVAQVIGLVDRAEYKRRQQPPGIKVTGKAFGRDRRMPITNRYKG